MARATLALLALPLLACAETMAPGLPDTGARDGAPVLPDAADADAPLAPPDAVSTAAFAAFWLERAGILRARHGECFKIPPAPPTPAPPVLIEAVAAGRLRFDAERGQACLSSLQTRSCAALLATFDDEQAGCAGAIEGQVGAGESCGVDEECRDPQLACVEGEGAVCGRRCAARLALGGDCSGGACLPGAFCRRLDDQGAAPSFRCAPLPGEGQACGAGCGAGLFCAREAYDGLEGIDQGVCRPRAAEGSCKNDWQCPLPLYCLRDAGAVAGHCGPPRAGVGEPCRPGFADCVPGTSCLAQAAAFSCQAWPGVGGACGYVEVSPGKSETVGCASGRCDLSAGIRRGVCAAPPVETPPVGGAAGAHCDFWNRCGERLRCQDRLCVAAACADPGAEHGVVTGQRSATHVRAVQVHGPASRQSTPLGRRIATLEPWRGRLYVGYGDYDANTGPISLSFFDPSSGAITEELALDTEAVALYRPLGDKLYVPAINPRGALPPDYAVGPPWSVVTAFPATHLFDVAALGTDLFAVGSLGSDAVVWRSRDGGAQWMETLRESSAGGALFMRYYFAASLADKLYVQAVPSETGQSRVFDGTSWSPGPNLLPRGGQGWNPRLFHGQLVYLSWQPIGREGGTLLVFDGKSPVRQVMSDEVLDFAATADVLYVLTRDGLVRRSDDLDHWWTLGATPGGARSLGILEGRVFLGGTDGRLFVIEDAP